MNDSPQAQPPAALDCPHHVVTMYSTKGRFAPPQRYWSCQDCGANFAPTAPDLPRAAADDKKIDLLAASWAETLSQGEQDVLLTSSLKRLSRMITEYVRTTPRAETGLTVEAALVQLKELTAHRCEISFFTSGQIAITVFANSIIPMGLFRTLKTTLDDAVNEVRAWAKSAEREGERS